MPFTPGDKNTPAAQYGKGSGDITAADANKSTVDAHAGEGLWPGQKKSAQLRTDFYDRKALYETRKDRYFSQLADVTAMPKHYGKKITKYHMMPLLDDRNINDQGLDKDGNAAANGNLYGSSKDIGLINAKLPVLGEHGGRVNRVGFSRIQLEGTMENYGIFTEFTEDMFNFDSMGDLYEHISRELITGAVQLTEAMIQTDIINAAGVIRFAGDATSKATMTGETGATLSLVDYADLQRMNITLDDLRSPKQIKMLKGSQNFDTVTVDNCRLMYVGSELIPTLTKMTDHFGNQAFVSVEHYGYSGSVREGTNMLHGEIGKIGQFRIIVVPEMQHEQGAGAAVATNAGYRAGKAVNSTGVETGADKYNIYPMVVIGSEAFTTIGFQTGGGANFKFKIRTRMPGEVLTNQDPYGKTGFSSLEFWYGFMPLRPERLAVQWSIAEL